MAIMTPYDMSKTRGWIGGSLLDSWTSIDLWSEGQGKILLLQENLKYKCFFLIKRFSDYEYARYYLNLYLKMRRTPTW